jgi:Ribbon-helix-helix protein, copG family
MEISIEIEEALLADVDKAAAVQKMSRSDAFVEAIRTWVSHHPKQSGWTVDWDNFEGDPDMTPFESYRWDFCLCCPNRRRDAV